MKSFKSINWAIAAIIVLSTSCDPIEERELLSNSYEADKIELSVVHASPGSNLFTLKMNTPGVTGYWDYTIGKGFSDEVEVLYPITGTQTFTYVVSSGYIPDGDLNRVEYITKTIDVDIAVLDKDVPVQYSYLVGEGSKTWVFDKSVADRYWYMTDADWNVFWWAPGDPTDGNGRIVFDLEGKPNFTYYASPDADPVTGSTWVFNADFSTLRILGSANILGVEGGGVSTTGSKEYHIKEFTADRLVLFMPGVVWSPGWVWVFKPLEN